MPTKFAALQAYCRPFLRAVADLGLYSLDSGVWGSLTTTKACPPHNAAYDCRAALSSNAQKYMLELVQLNVCTHTTLQLHWLRREASLFAGPFFTIKQAGWCKGRTILLRSHAKKK